MSSQSRTDVLQKTKELGIERLTQREGESVLVKRGAINWTQHDFSRYPRALAIMMDDSAMWPGPRGFRDGNMTFEHFVKMPDQEGTPEIDDDLQGELIDDLFWIVSSLEKEKNARGQPIVTRIDRVNARIVESHDVTLEVQGVVVTLNLNF